jgi:hypothetical protein
MIATAAIAGFGCALCRFRFRSLFPGHHITTHKSSYKHDYFDGKGLLNVLKFRDNL